MSSRVESPIFEKEEVKDAVRESFERLDFPIEQLGEMRNQLYLTEKRSHFNEDARQVGAGIEHMWEETCEAYPEINFTKEDQNNILLAAPIHDVGKAGFPSADAFTQQAILDLYANDELDNPNEELEIAIKKTFPRDRARQFLEKLADCGFTLGTDHDSTMRDFWDKHIEWGYAMMNTYGQSLPEETKIIAASHHMGRPGKRSFNPYNIPQGGVRLDSIEDPEMKKLTVLSRLFILADTAQASAMRFGRRGESLHTAVEKDLNHQGFGEDQTMQKLFEIFKRHVDDENLWHVEGKEEAIQEVGG